MSPSATTSLPDFANPGKAVIPPSKLAHLVLRAWDFEKQKQWYLDFLGAKIQYENPMLAFLTYDEEHHRVALLNENQPGKKAPKDNSLIHFAFTFPTLPDLLLSYRQRLQHNIKPSWCINHGPTISLYYIDPEGNKIETQWDVFEDAEDANKFMMSEEFAENPFGAAFDPEEMIERLLKGESVEVLAKRERIGKRGIEVVPEEMR